jgi:hypothetical protein
MTLSLQHRLMASFEAANFGLAANRTRLHNRLAVQE